MTKILRRAALVAVALAAVAAGTVAPSAFAHDPEGLDAIGLAGNGTELVAFRTDDPGGAQDLGAISGLSTDARLIGIDYRVQNGALYGVGNAGGIYLLDDETAAATRVGQLTAVLLGTDFGVDFNPAANALRIISDNGQNLRQPFGAGDAPVGGTVSDTTLSRSGTFGPASGVTAAAYKDNDLSPDTTTRLYDLDTTRNRLVIQEPANSGILTGVGPEGRLGDIPRTAGLDIFSDLDDDGVAVDNDAFATAALAGTTHLLTIDLFTGQPTSRGTFPRPDLTDLALPPTQ